jgi:AraC-like DNA-binding protein
MPAVTSIRWENAFRVVVPQINADGLLVQTFDAALPVQVRFYSYDPGRDYRSCRHNYFEVFYVSSGEALFRIGEKCFPVKTGDLVVINSTHFHRMEVPKKNRGTGVRGVLLYFLPELFQGAGAAREDGEYLAPFLQQEDGFPHVITADTEVPARVYEGLRRISSELPAKTARARLTVKTHLRLILVELLNHYAAWQGASDSIERRHRQIERLLPLFRYLDERYATQITLEEAAQVARMSKSHFIHFMKHVTGMSFVSYLNQFRVSKALSLMQTTDKSLAEISYEIGFCDQSYFGQVFRKLLKTTPREYRLRLDSERAQLATSVFHNKK